MSTFKTDSGQVVGYTDHGGDGPPLVFLHALFMNGTMFQSQVDALGEDYRAITIDARGHGESPTAESFDFWDVARDVLAVLDHLEVEEATLAGTSQGSVVAMRAALLRPETVSALVLMGSSANAEPPEATETLLQIVAAWREVGPADPLLEQIAGVVLGDYPNVSPWQDLWRTLTADDVARNVDAVISRDALTSRVPDLNMPALVLHGSADNVFPVTEGEQLADLLPGSGDAVVIEGGAHFVSLTDAAAANDRIGKFLSEQS